jgi:hypothetical protein
LGKTITLLWKFHILWLCVLNVGERDRKQDWVHRTAVDLVSAAALASAVVAGAILNYFQHCFSSVISSRPSLGPIQFHFLWLPGAPPPGVKLPGREADHSPPTSVEVKKTWISLRHMP